ncbi:hypothetical protein BOX15_Mlig029926g1 [Macrostomum lignano]|uniref:Uncharacterized protein n=1 Tax=Macrostomum lignano TaxID=282301 RepID=A0A267H2D5_9PLAT|nr:hypothetical protein BOX15_Mlig029926g1 [Macrostomum lignano]
MSDRYGDCAAPAFDKSGKRGTGLWLAAKARVRQIYYQYLLITAASALEPIEVAVFNSLMLLLAGLCCFYGCTMAAHCFAWSASFLPDKWQQLLPDWLQSGVSTHAARVGSGEL